MDRNSIMAFALSMLVFTGWAMWQSQRHPASELALEQLQPAAEAMRDIRDLSLDRPSPSDSRGSIPSRAYEARTAPGEVEAVAEVLPTAPAVEPWSRVFEFPLYRVEVTNRGAGLLSWTLLDERYTERMPDGERPLEVLALEAPYDISLRTPLWELGLGDLGNEVYEVETEDMQGVAFVLERGGITIRKEYRFDPESYGFHLSMSIQNDSNRVIEPSFGVEWLAQTSPGQDFTEQSLLTLHNGEVQREALAGLGKPGFFSFLGGGDPNEPPTYRRDVGWVGVDLKYFVSVLMTDRVRTATAVFEPIVPGEVGAAILKFEPEALPPGNIVTHEFRGYIGPKEPALLEQVGSDLVKSIDFGYQWIAPLTRFFGSFLNVVYSFVGNYGVAIIIMTILVRVFTLPIMQRQMKSMERMRALQPQLKELQEKYKEDRQKLSEEQMKMYKREGVNPLGGCLPMLLQFPVFIGLFYALQSSIELRHAPFFGYIQDLSAPATLFTIPGIELPIRLLPLFMGASMVLQQRLTPMTMDPAQARMMMTVMPVMMTVLFYQFPSGLVLYWMVSNLLGIAHQIWVGRMQRAKSAA